jgi:hypothetical protein
MIAMATAILAGTSGIATAAIKTQTVAYQQGNTTPEGYLAWDDSVQGKRPGVLVVHEWTGLGDFVKTRAKMLAEMGYIAFAADIYGKGIRPKGPQQAAAEAGKYKNDRKAVAWLERVKVAIRKHLGDDTWARFEVICEVHHDEVYSDVECAIAEINFLGRIVQLLESQREQSHKPKARSMTDTTTDTLDSSDRLLLTFDLSEITGEPGNRGVPRLYTGATEVREMLDQIFHLMKTKVPPGYRAGAWLWPVVATWCQGSKDISPPLRSQGIEPISQRVPNARGGHSTGLGHNFALAHAGCNSSKSDYLAAEDHLTAWQERNRVHCEELASRFAAAEVISDLPASVRIARWAYEQAEQAGGQVWLAKDAFKHLGPEWRLVLGI